MTDQEIRAKAVEAAARIYEGSNKESASYSIVAIAERLVRYIQTGM